MGEFSAGKSTLANLLLGTSYLPVQVVATQLPPVLISKGDGAPYRVDLEGGQHPVDLAALAEVPLENTAHIHIFSGAELLDRCDLIDMPGISDPNMSPEVWQRLISVVDGVIWCSHATQAWRQSEASVWGQMDPALYDNSILLLTRIDKLISQHDRGRVIRRVRKETEGLFAHCLPISLLQATDDQSDIATWEDSGGSAFARALAEVIAMMAPGPGARKAAVRSVSIPGLAPQTSPDGPISPRRVTPRRVPGTVRTSSQNSLVDRHQIKLSRAGANLPSSDPPFH